MLNKTGHSSSHERLYVNRAKGIKPASRVFIEAYERSGSNLLRFGRG
jgi:hypothetical protein